MIVNTAINIWFTCSGRMDDSRSCRPTGNAGGGDLRFLNDNQEPEVLFLWK
ncbi:hypothetical protein [Corynebacterium efficiens YS-314]|uniref:Uncharacterized protein n=1 Tax=Corynebacterium efficiens (strain DSM 44549 / YS-314 / AJ 12310 / JCM 11189 / NBRC 100395) TaxID=196164 RepID=Q8FPC2_COREF|nr:hypothetical protein [Corynebacterium efficiens YS-314]